MFEKLMFFLLNASCDFFFKVNKILKEWIDFENLYYFNFNLKTRQLLMT